MPNADSTLYTCPMHPQVQSEVPGRCPICGMALVRQGDQRAHGGVPSKSWIVTYRPLMIIIGLILLATAAVAVQDASSGTFSWQRTATHFMAGFFLVFAGFKLLDLKGFAEGYRTYDLLAQRLPAYGYLYPFLELLLGLSYLANTAPWWTNVATLILMTFSGIGVAIKVAKRERFQCVCLGTIMNVPLTTVTLVEDFGMAAMAALMLWMTRTPALS